ncbi:MAG: sigma 54-interacting transcriptional regulator [Planctomycetota bacterium]|nr:sigma 54-interacting transcriptional regulator [Planctomycetota bacterium]
MDENNRLTAKRQIARLLGCSSLPICVLSEDDTLVFANEAIGVLLGRSPESLLGLQCNSASPADGTPEALLAGFFALPVHWSRKVLKLIPEAGPVPGQLATAADEVHWLRCLIPLEQENGCVLCVFSPNSNQVLDDFVDVRSSASQRILRENRKHFTYLDEMWYLQGESTATKKALEQVQLAVTNSLPLIVYGPPGSGRSWLAQSIQSQRRGLLGEDRKFEAGDSFVRIDCSLMDADLLRSMLEVVEESQVNLKVMPTVLLDNLECLPSECLSTLESFLRGPAPATRMATCDETAIDALLEKDQRWRNILSRTSVLRIDLPRLIDRLEDLDTVVSAWSMAQPKSKSSRYEICETLMEALMAYPWPGDVEELNEALKHATAKCEGEKLTEKDLPVNIRTCVSHIEQSQVDETVDLDAILEDVERTMILRALERYPQNKTSAAKLLNISRARLLRRLQQWGIQSASGPGEGDDDLPVFNEVT